MRISEALSKARDIQVEFESATLNVTYRPISYTYAEMEAMSAASAPLDENASKEEQSARLRRVIDITKKVVVAWDLEDEEGITIDPQNEDALRQVPMNVFGEIMKTIRRDQAVSGEAESPSSDG